MTRQEEMAARVASKVATISTRLHDLANEISKVKVSADTYDHLPNYSEVAHEVVRQILAEVSALRLDSLISSAADADRELLGGGLASVVEETVTVTLTAAVFDWIQFNTSWGLQGAGDSKVAESARHKILSAKGLKVDLTISEARELQEILDSIAGSGEAMSSSERGSAAAAYRAIRGSALRIQEMLP